MRFLLICTLKSSRQLCFLSEKGTEKYRNSTKKRKYTGFRTSQTDIKLQLAAMESKLNKEEYYHPVSSIFA